MSTIHIHQTMSLTPEQYIAGLTDFGPGREKVFSKSADGYLKVHSVGPTEADVTEGSGGVWERLHYDWSNPTASSSTPPIPHVEQLVGLTTSSSNCRVEDRRGRHDHPPGQKRQGKTARAGPRDSRKERPRQGVRQQHQGDRGQRRGRLTTHLEPRILMGALGSVVGGSMRAR